MAEKGRSTQNLVNIFPRWTNIRSDEQSLGFQLINSVAKNFDYLRKQQMDFEGNHYLSTSKVSDIDLFYAYAFPGDYEFTKEDNDDTEFTYTAPTVVGRLDNVDYTLTLAENNDIESFWYTSVPTRLSLNTNAPADHLVSSGLVIRSPLEILPPSGLCHIPNKLTLILEGSTSCLNIEDNKLIRKGLVYVHGKTREGSEVTEELLFIHDDTLQTYHEFSYIFESGINIYGINEPDETTLNVYSANFNATDYLVEYNDLDFTADKDPMPLFWSVGSGENNIPTLDLNKYDVDEIELRVNGFTTKHTILKQEMLSTSGTNIEIVDIAPEPKSDRIWAVSETHLYLYSASFPYSTLNTLNTKQYGAASVVEPNSYYVTLNDEVEINYIWKVPSLGFVAHRAWVIKPDGVTKSLESGAEVTYHTDASSWIYGEPRQRRIRDSEFYTLSQHGDYVFCLEAKYTDDSTSIDKRVVTVLYQNAIAEYDLTTLDLSDITGIDFDSEYKLWVLDTNNIKYQIDKHYDNMIIDFDKKYLYFKDNYNQLTISSASNDTLIVLPNS